MAGALLEVQDLWLSRDNCPILRGVNLRLFPGEIHVLLGLNGSGKSTLAHCLMGSAGYTPEKGRILFDGQDITTKSITERAKLGITLAWQEPARFEGLLVGKYVSLGAGEKPRERVYEALDAVALTPQVYGRRAVDQALSGGERKRVELASVYAMHPRLAILDEPDSGIDVLSLTDIAALIRKMADDGCAVLLITHRDELANSGHVTSIMCAGSVIHTGQPEEARRFFATRCMPHLTQKGGQPWTVGADPQGEGEGIQGQGPSAEEPEVREA